jgi:alpha-L-rhamnosidase
MNLRIIVAFLFAASVLAGESARPIWPTGREQEMNLLVGFRAVIDAPKTKPVHLRVAASTLYRAFVNGQFAGWGPARGPHGFYRVDEWDVTASLTPGRNVIAIEVAGYNINSYWILNQPSFLLAEVTSGDAVLASTAGDGVPFAASILNQRIQKVQRYAFQRAFVEAYSLHAGFDRWRRDPDAPFTAVPCSVADGKTLIPRRTPYPDFALRQPVRHVAEGQVVPATTPVKPWADRSLTGIGPKFLGYPQKDLAVTLTTDLDNLSFVHKTALQAPYAWSDSVRLASGQFHTFDFGTDLSGFLGVRLIVRKATHVYLLFDEMLLNDDVAYKRMYTVNAISWQLEPGSYDLESFEPYTARFLKVMVTEGECSLERVYLREYANPDVWRADFASSDPGLNRLFAAGRETYRQNSVDLFTDCPQRERAGWLCDSYFTGRVEHLLTGRPTVEKAFLENFLLPARFEYLPDGMIPMCYPADHNDGTFIPNWSLWFVLQLEEYLARSGDREMVDALRPRVLKLLDYFKPFRNSDGLLEKLQSWVFIEWSHANDFVQDVNYPSNMLYAAALDSAGRLYNMPDLVSDAERLRETIRKQSFDGEYFVDNAVRENGVLKVTHNRSETCQYYAFYFGTATPELYGRLWNRLLDDFGPDRAKRGLYPDIYPANAFVGNVLRMELLSRAGRSEQFLTESRAYWLYMADRTGTLWENIGDEASLNHGFASHVVNNLYRDVLGLYRIDSVAKQVEVRFTDLSLAWCEGRVPVPGGDVSLRWTRDGGSISYRIDVPAGYRVKLTNLTHATLHASI